MPITRIALDRRARRGAALALGLLLPLPAMADELYRWVDEDGGVHYSDAPPAEATRGRHARMRKDGSEREEVDPSAPEADAGAQEEGAGDDSESARRDRVLLQTYTSVEEIEHTRERHLENIEGEIGLAERRLRRARSRVERYDDLLEELPQDSEHRPEMKRQRKQAIGKLERRREALEALRDRRERVEQRFSEDIARFRELQSDNGS